jgi:uncharacterized protein YacL
VTTDQPLTARLEQEARQRHLLVQVLRATLIILLFVVTALSIVTESTENRLGVALEERWWLAVGLVILFFAAVVGIDILTPRRKLSTISAILFGSFAGIIATAILGIIIDFFLNTYGWASEFQRLALSAKLILGLGLCYLGITTVLQTQDDFRLVIPYVEFAKQYRAVRPLVLDTSAIIDGRILALAELSVIQAPFIVPAFVIRELQTLADSGDRLKRARGRRGLDILARLQQTPTIELSIDASDTPGTDADSKLLDLAERAPATIVTTDSGLARVALLRSIAILNVNDLASALRPTALPGQRLIVELIRPGDHPGQAVGYLDDGTMVVAENGAPAIGTTTTLLITSSTTTAAGRLIFGRIPSSPTDPPARAPTDAHAATDAERAAGVTTDLGVLDAPNEAPETPEAPSAFDPRIAQPDEQSDEQPGDPHTPRTPSPGSESHSPASPFGPHRAKKPPPSPRNPRRG